MNVYLTLLAGRSHSRTEPSSMAVATISLAGLNETDDTAPSLAQHRHWFGGGCDLSCC